MHRTRASIYSIHYFLFVNIADRLILEGRFRNYSQNIGGEYVK